MQFILILFTILSLLISCSEKGAVSQKKESVSPQKKAVTTESVEKKKSPQKEVKTTPQKKGEIPVSVQWKRYQNTRQKAQEAASEKRFKESAELYALAAKYTLELNRPGVASWQYNSAGKELINAFKERVDYTGIMKKMNLTKDKKVRKKLQDTMHKRFAKEFSLLEPAKEYLLLAENADSKHSKADGNRGKRLSLIKNNLAFIIWIADFTKEQR
ncbi:hypothetical protein KAH37_08055 [bacterium]|nr:hypothetical protein [bacterium]